MKSKIIIPIVAGIFVFAISAFATPITYISNPITGGIHQSFFGSCATTNGVESQCFTDIDYKGNRDITDFLWWGESFTDIGQYGGFHFQIFDNAADDKPGTEVFSETFDGLGDGLTFTRIGPRYWGYRVHLTTPFVGVKGKYWLSVTAGGPGAEELDHLWGWAANQTTRLWNDDWQYYLDDSGNWQWATPGPGDLAFEVMGDELIPEPTSLTLLGIGLAGLLAALRFRQI